MRARRFARNERLRLHGTRHFWVLGLLAGCAPEPTSVATVDPWAELAPAAVADQNPSPTVVEVELEAAPSVHAFPGTESTPVWTYNGTLPGPLIDARVGDELVVHFRNSLPEATSVHWHGVRLPNAMDGVSRSLHGMTSGTPATPPGGTFDYRFQLKDAGLFWFHPHVRSDEQLNKGLYGLIRVRGDQEPAADHDGVVALDDVGLLPDGTLPTYLDDESKMMGRGGDILLFNGHHLPTVPWRAGALERLRFVNAANGRFFHLRLEGYTFWVIGTDGGLLPKPYESERLLIPPGKRYDVLVIPTGAPGQDTTLWNDPYDRGHDSGSAPPAIVATFRIQDRPALLGRQLPMAFRAIEALPADMPADPTFELNEGFDTNGELIFTVNGHSGMDVPVVEATLGEVRKFEVRNLSEMDHPFHLHGSFFQVVERNGLPTEGTWLANEDTVIVPSKGRLQLVTRFEEPGQWMYHCHILEHSELGMMGFVDVTP